MKSRRSRKRWVVVSGGQTGVDRAALEAAMAFSLPVGGWVPKGRLAEDGVIPSSYDFLKEMPEGGYRARTKANVRDSDATLILVDQMPLVGGTALTAEVAEELDSPLKVVNLEAVDARGQIVLWMRELECRPEIGDVIRMNVAGPRESGAPGIFEKAMEVLSWVFGHLTERDRKSDHAN